MIGATKNALTEAISSLSGTVDLLEQEPILAALAGAIPPAAWLIATAIKNILPEESAWQARLVRFAAALTEILVENILLLSSIFVGGCVLGAGWVHDSWFREDLIDDLELVAENIVIGAACGGALGVGGRIWVGRRFEKTVLSWVHGTMKTETDPANEQTDIRTIDKYLPDPKKIKIDHLAAFRKAIEQDAYFLGVDEVSIDVFIPAEDLESTHVQVMGGTGKGKGVQSTIVLIQAAMRGRAIYIMDPKRDQYMRKVWAAVCQKLGIPFHYVDLRQQVPQMNVLRGVNAQQLEELLIVGLNLRRKGTDSDHYKNFERYVVYLLSELANGNTEITFQTIVDQASDVLSEESLARAESVLLQLEELSRVEAINTIEGPDLATPLSQGGVFFVTGEEERENVILVQKMIVLRVMQLLKNRTPQQTKHAFIQLDELPLIGSPSSIVAFPMVRDKFCTLIVTHQTRADYNSIPGIDPEEARSKVENNCGIKWLYAGDDFEYLEWAAKKSGYIRFRKKRHQITTNSMNVELMGSELTLDEDTRTRVDENMIMALPKFCALYVNGPQTRIAFTHPFKIDLKEAEIKPVAPYPNKKSVTEEFAPGEEPQNTPTTKTPVDKTDPGDEFL